MRTPLAALLLILAGSLTGCDGFSDTSRFDGTVIDAVSGEPIEGIFMTVRTAATLGAGTIVASDITDAEGRYGIRYEGRSKTLYANLRNFGEEGPQNPNYYDRSVVGGVEIVRLERSHLYGE